jgi:hypothetical protein
LAHGVSERRREGGREGGELVNGRTARKKVRREGGREGGMMMLNVPFNA